MTATMNQTQPVLTNRLSRLMGERRVSMLAVARATGLSYTTVFQLFHDRSTRYDKATLESLCAYFGVGLEHILEWTPAPTPPQPEAEV